MTTLVNCVHQNSFDRIGMTFYVRFINIGQQALILIFILQFIDCVDTVKIVMESKFRKSKSSTKLLFDHCLEKYSNYSAVLFFLYIAI